mmetsp:Transcript_122532/g.216978  ORF Transcript_122532/g.216978 Transcript_122532/m.216978 type:complete len:235 (+) Transcript_122532:3-707(+)
MMMKGGVWMYWLYAQKEAILNPQVLKMQCTGPCLLIRPGSYEPSHAPVSYKRLWRSHAALLQDGRCLVHVLLAGLLLLELCVALRDSPGFDLADRGRARASRCGIDGAPIAFGCPSTHPGLGVHGEATTPAFMLEGAQTNLTAPLRLQFLDHCPDVVRLKPTAAADVANAHFPSLASEFLDLKAMADARLQSKGELWQVNEALLAMLCATLRCVINNRLDAKVEVWIAHVTRCF